MENREQLTTSSAPPPSKKKDSHTENSSLHMSNRERSRSAPQRECVREQHSITAGDVRARTYSSIHLWSGTSTQRFCFSAGRRKAIVISTTADVSSAATASKSSLGQKIGYSIRWVF
jgi:hypothetical protein